MGDSVAQLVILKFEIKSLTVDKGRISNYGQVSSSAPLELRHYIVHVISDCQESDESFESRRACMASVFSFVWFTIFKEQIKPEE